MPKGIDWLTWRVLTSERISVTKHEIENGWTLDDVLDAHEVLDLHQDLEVMAANERYLESLTRKGGRRV